MRASFASRTQSDAYSGERVSQYAAWRRKISACREAPLVGADVRTRGLCPGVHLRGRPGAMASKQTPTRSAERSLRLLGQLAERGRIADREVGEHLAVKLDVRRPQAGDELVVRKTVSTRARVDAHDPEAAKRALLVLAVAVGVDERVLDLLLRVLVVRALEAPVAFRLLEHLAALLLRVNGSLDARHRLTPSPVAAWRPARSPSRPGGTY